MVTLGPAHGQPTKLALRHRSVTVDIPARLGSSESPDLESRCRSEWVGALRIHQPGLLRYSFAVSSGHPLSRSLQRIGVPKAQQRSPRPNPEPEPEPDFSRPATMTRPDELAHQAHRSTCTATASRESRPLRIWMPQGSRGEQVASDQECRGSAPAFRLTVRRGCDAHCPLSRD